MAYLLTSLAGLPVFEMWFYFQEAIPQITRYLQKFPIINSNCIQYILFVTEKSWKLPMSKGVEWVNKHHVPIKRSEVDLNAQKQKEYPRDILLRCFKK